MTFPIDIKSNLSEIENKIKSGINKEGGISMMAVIEIKENVFEIAQHHGDSNQLSIKKTKFLDHFCNLIYLNKVDSSMFECI